MNEFHFNTAVPHTYCEMSPTSYSELKEIPYAGYSSGSYFGKNHLITLIKTAFRYNIFRLRLLFIKNNPVTHSYSERMLLMIQEYKQRRRYKKQYACKISDLEGKEYVYMPLHKEPETGLQMMSPEFYNQHSMIMSIAQNLPAGLRLVIKENNKTFGRRPFVFYEQTADLKNVIFIDDEESSIRLIEGAICTITVSGSAGFEAAIRGKPVISYGRHNMYNCLPHVLVVTDLSQIKHYVRRILSGEFSIDECAKEGRNLLKSVLDHSFDLEGAGTGGTINKNMILKNELIGRVTDKLIDSLNYSDDVVLN